MSRRKKASEAETVESIKGFDDFEMRLGDMMRGERATMGKSLLDVQRDLKIKATYIAAIENADATAFESKGFIAGYVRSYARYLNIDPEWAYENFCNESGFTGGAGIGSAPSSSRGKARSGASSVKSGFRDPLAEPSVSFIPAAEQSFSTIEPRAIGSLAVLLALISAIGYGGWAVLQEVQKVQFVPVDQAPGVVASLDPLQQVYDPAGEESEDVAAIAAPESFDRLYRPQALDVPVLVARDGPIATIDPRSVGALAEPPAPPAAGTAMAGTPAVTDDPALPDDGATNGETTVKVVGDDPTEVVLFAVRPSWVRVRATDGTIIFEKILDAGEQFAIPATEEPALLRAGNSGSVYFSIDGKTYGPAGAGPSVVKDVALSADALTTSYEVADLDRDADLARFVNVAEATPSQ